VVLAHRQKVVDARDVIDRVGQQAHTLLPRVAEHFHVFLRHFGGGACAKDARRVYDLR